MLNTDQQGTHDDRDVEHHTAAGGGARTDYGGMDQNLGQVDLASASEVAADPPGGLGTDIGGGSGEIGEDEAATRSSSPDDSPSA
jgi:hypothetical protein